MSCETIRVEQDGRTAVVWLNRPKVHNAFNDVMIRELREAFIGFAADASVRSVLLTGEGKSFCAGVDLKWLGGGREAPFEKHFAETLDLSRMFRAIYDLDKPVIAAVNGTALGGGVGFLGVADIVYAAEDAMLGLSEVKIGVVPACISPYLFIKSSQRSRLKEHFISGRRFSAAEGERAGLIDYVVARDRLLESALEKAAALRNAAPLAQGMCKQLFRDVPGMSLDEAMRHTAEVLARLRTGDEARQGIDAFFAKREIDWR
ncbi:MAG: enoyl-CoA hydratase-related protein [Elusimicrobiota bacterium]